MVMVVVMVMMAILVTSRAVLPTRLVTRTGSTTPLSIVTAIIVLLLLCLAMAFLHVGAIVRSRINVLARNEVLIAAAAFPPRSFYKRF